MADGKDISPNYDKKDDNLLENDISVSFEDEKELEKYGVWVKTGPEEIDDIDDMDDYNLSDLEDEAVISEEEEELLGELEKELTDDDLTISDIENDLDMDISDLDDLELEELTNTADIPENKSETEENIVDEEPFDLDIDFDDELNEVEELNTKPANESSTNQVHEDSLLDEDIDLDVLELENLDLDDLELDELELDEIEPVKTENLDTEELDLSLEDDIDLDVDSLLVNDVDDDLDIDVLLNEELGDLQIDDTLEDLDELEDITNQQEENILDDNPIVELSNDEDFNETEKIIDDLTELDDLDDTEFENIIETDNLEVKNTTESTTIASDILNKIEEELLSIKSELHDVKKELSILKPVSNNIAVSENLDSQNEEPGFFEEDEDETIALTGDELDNILNTADIIEETGAESETPDELLEIDDSTSSFDGESLLIDNDDIITIEDEEIHPSVEDSEDLNNLEDNIIDIEENLDDIEEIELIEDESLQNTEIGINEENSLQGDIHLADLDSLEIDTIGNDNSDISEVIDTDLSELDTDLDELDTDLDELDTDLDELDTDLDELDTDLDELDTDLDNTKEELPVTDLTEGDNVEVNVDFNSNETDLIPENASEPEGSVSIDMELPEMQEDEDLTNISPQLKTEIKSVLSYMDHLLESLPEDKIDEFANSEHYEVYKKLFEELGLN